MSALSLFTGIISRGIILVTLSDNKVYAQDADMMDIMYSVMIMSRANEESEMKSQRAAKSWKEQRQQARSEGHIIKNARRPAWLNQDLSLIPEHTSTIKRIFEMAINGYGYSKIAQILDNEGIKTPRGSRWRPSYLQHILRNRAIMGEYQPHRMDGKQRVPDGEPIPNYYPAIVPPRRITQHREPLTSETGEVQAVAKVNLETSSRA